MKLRIKFLGIEAGGKPVVILNKDDAEELGVRSLGRIKLHYSRKNLNCIVNTTTKIIDRGVVGVYNEVRSVLKLKERDTVDVELSKFPESLNFIINKLKGRKLNYEEINEIVKDAVEGNLNDAEIAAFVTSIYDRGMDLDEAASLAISMVNSGKVLKLDRKVIVDKHSIGGVPGDKTTLIAVPIIAACGLTIPKTSSRAITSAAGSADRAEVLMPVELDIDEMKKVVEKTNGCIVWGGALNLSPADDLFIQVEYPLSIDPMMLPSMMSKKRAVGANHLVIDIPTGRGSKIKTIGDAHLLAKDFIELGNRLGIKTRCAVTFGEQPIGFCVGAGLEAKEALEILMRKKFVTDVVDKATHIAGVLLEMTGKKNGQQIALEVLRSGKAENKLREIIAAQGGDPEIKPEDIKIGDYGFDVCADKPGYVMWINNTGVASLGRAAGSPKDKGAGIVFYKKIGDRVNKDEKLFTVYAEKSSKLERVRKIIDEDKIVGVGERREMLIDIVKEVPAHKKAFIMER
jgi:AMP phosphorylase